jgi:tRNA dimethylallyltransferase
MAEQQPQLIVIAGPTASGKTDFAIELAQHYQTEILSADSRQLYRELSIGTAKPSAEQLALVPHHFINHCSIHDNYNVGIFEKEALLLLDKLFQKHQVVILAGGTGLFIKAVCEGLDELPTANEAIRKQLQEELENFGVDYLFNKLQNLDPEGSKAVDAKNPHRIMRALEIVLETGKSHLTHKTKTIIKRPFAIKKIWMDIERSELYNRINNRVDSMMENGLWEEAKSVYPFKHLNALNTVGYSELFDYFDDKYSLEEAIDKIKQHTRNYAKRQITWFRKDEDFVMHHAFKR